MPGTIRVSVLEAVDLPGSFSDGTSGKDLTAKVTLGTRQFKTESRDVDEGRSDSWNSSFSFLVTNLQDKLVVAICDNKDQCLTQTCIEVPSIIEKGSRDEFVELKGGGQIHLSMSFVLTDEEQKKIEKMRLAVFKKREGECGTRTIVFRDVQPYSENNVEAASAVTITEVDDSSLVKNKDSQETANGPLGFGSTTKHLTPTLTFDYARAVGFQSRQECKRIGKKTNIWAPNYVSHKVKASIDDVNSEEQTVKVCAENQVKVDNSEYDMAGSSALSIKSSHRAGSSVTRLTDSAASLTVSPFMQDSATGKVSSCAVKIEADVLESTLLKGRDEFVVPANVLVEDKWSIERQRVRSVAPAAVANSFYKQSTLFGDMRKTDFKGGATCCHFRNLTQGQQAVGALHIRKEVLKFDAPSGQGLRPEARPGPGARWALKTDLDTRWSLSEKMRRFVRIEWNGQVPARFKARAGIFKLMKAAAGSHESSGDDQTLQERNNLSDSIEAFLNKVVSGATILLAALFMMWPLPEHRSDGSSGDDV